VFSVNPVQGDVVSGNLPQLFGTAARVSKNGNLGFQSDDNTADAVAIAAASKLYEITTAFTVSLWIEVSAVTNYSNFFSVPYRQTGWTTPYNS
jgi:hypothetical protein